MNEIKMHAMFVLLGCLPVIFGASLVFVVYCVFGWGGLKVTGMWLGAIFAGVAALGLLVAQLWSFGVQIYAAFYETWGADK